MNPALDRWILVAGWTLVHFVWQGALIAFAAAVCLRLLRTASSHARYVVACAALATMLIAPAVTARLVSTSAPAGQDTAPWPLEFSTSLPERGQPPAAIWPPRAAAPGGISFSMEAARLVVSRSLPLVVTTWLAGVALLLVRLAGGWLRVRRLHRASLAISASCWQTMSDRLASRLRLARAVHVVDSLLVDAPTVLGWLRPVILLPIAALANLTPGQVEAILAHELAHIRRHDYLVNLLQTTVETLLFYHPAVWWVSSRIRAEREHCCDDVAVDLCGDAVGYAAALADLETARTGRPVPIGQAALALAATDGSLLERVRRVLQVPADDRSQPRSQTMPAMIAAVLVLLLVAGAAGLNRQPVQASTAIQAEVDRARLLLDAPRGPSLVFRHRDERVIEAQLQPRPRGNGQARETIIVRVQRQATPVQTSSTIVTGTVTDTSGEGVQDAAVVLTDIGTAPDRTARTDQSGRFEFVSPPVGQYMIGVSAAGLDAFHGRLTVIPGEKVQLNVTLQIQPLAIGTTAGRPAGPAPLPEGFVCVDSLCGPRATVEMLARDVELRLQERRNQRAQPALLPLMNTVPVRYPQELWDALIEGSVVLEGHVATNGSPILRSVAPVHPGLAKAALEAVGQWRFEPARLHGVAVESPLKVTINFRLHN